MIGRRRTRSDDRGATVVELAIALPIIFAMILALVNFGLIEASDSSASNGAREGARVGILEYLDADVVGSPSRLLIEEAARAQLGGLVSGPVIDVRCQRPAGASFDTVPCNDGIVLNRDLIEVTVDWSSVSPFSTGTRTERARMAIIGRPDLADIVPPSTTSTSSTSAPSPNPSCVITGVNVTSQPAGFALRNQGDLRDNETFTAVTTGGGCGAMTFAWPSTIGYADIVVPAPNAGPGRYSVVLPRHTGTWAVSTTYVVDTRGAVGSPFSQPFRTS